MNILQMGSSTLNPESHPMDTQERDTDSGNTSVHTTEAVRVGKLHPNVEMTTTSRDRTDGEVDVLGTHNNESGSKSTTLVRSQPNDDNSDGDTLQDEMSMMAPLTNTIRPKKLKTERDEPVSRSRNRSKTRFKSTNK